MPNDRHDRYDRPAPSDRTTAPNKDDFWDIDRLLPPKPARRSAPMPRPTPSAVEIELAPHAHTERSTREPSSVPVTDASLTSERVANARARAEQARAEADRLRAEAARTRREGTLTAGDRPEAIGAGQEPRHTPEKEAPVSASSLTRFVPPHTAEEGKEEQGPLLAYKPGGALLRHVKIYAWHAGYHYFDQFGKDAVEYAALPAPAEAQPTGFFSYFPQYVQLNRRQSAWYLYWREKVRNGICPATDYAYVLLYIFELLNLPAEDALTARRHRDLLAAVWVAYRRTHPQLDHYMCEWLCDYCLIHALPAPVDILAPALDAIIEGSRLKEFYLGAVVEGVENAERAGAGDHSLETARILLRHCCQYDYRKSKFAQGEHKALFDATIPAAVAAVLPLLLGSQGREPAITMLESTVKRDAYTGALCAYSNKRRIEVAYTSFSRSHELRFLIADMVKHTENRLRSWIGVRSRLSVMSLPIPLREALDAYLAPHAPAKSPVAPKKKEPARPAYEAQYDLPRKALSVADADAIEQSSWETTKRLTEAFGDTVALPVVERQNASPIADVSTQSAPLVPASSLSSWVPPAVPLPAAPPLPPPPSEATAPLSLPAPVTSDTSSPLAPYASFLAAALSGDPAAQRAAAKALGKMPDALADAVNAITADGDIGDIILEDDGTGFYAVLEDYRADVERMMRS